MIKLLIFILFFLMVSACGSETREQDDTSVFESLSDIKDFADYMEEISEEIDEIEEEGDALLVATPLTNDQLKIFLPGDLHGLPRKRFSVGNQLLIGLVTAEASYENEEEQKIDLILKDGAGEAGSAMTQMYRLVLTGDFERQTEDGYEKSLNFGGYRGTEKFSKYDNQDRINTELTLLIENRFVVTLSAINISIEDLKKAANELDLDKLKNLAQE